MRRTAALLMTSLLASGAALTAPGVAQAQESGPAGTTASGCWAYAAGWQAIGTCSGIDPLQTWNVYATCRYWNFDHTVQFSRPTYGFSMLGNGTTSASCGVGDEVSFPGITLGRVLPPEPAGPVGQITGYANKCVDVSGAATNNGTKIDIWDCNGTNAQKWKVAADGTVRALGKCMDVKGAGTANHTLVQLYDCNGTGAQQWRAQPDGSLVNPQSGRCLDDLGFVTTNGNQLGIWDCNGADNQKWNLPV
ncbi:ricin-type beta-trefoil lectin domain protein [Kitasatospora sp. NPDC050543]|uniref:ricin-type beta-trefoil lectin domain protein n=1 Tax=Kitasatospora sp. NPDC050543 TaxID=3364054 RepID=UPI0037B089EC